jgi:hypothetical protein
MRETYPVVLLERKASRLRKETGNPAYRSKLASNLSPTALIKHAIVRPMKMLFLSPIVTAMCIYIAVLYGLLYILFTTYTFVFERVYHFSTSTAGLSFLGSGIGTIVGLAFCGTQSDRIIKAKQSSSTPLKPEDRLPLLITVCASFHTKFTFWGEPRAETCSKSFSRNLQYCKLPKQLPDSLSALVLSLFYNANLQ